MEPRIQYARTSDGVPIAWWALGDGPVLVSSGLPQSHIGLEWQTPAWRTIYEQASRFWRLVRFDHRGCGLSERDVVDFPIDALVRDVEAVVDQLGVPQIRLMASVLACPVALAYAARHAERVSHLVLVDAPSQGAPVPPMLTKLRDAGDADWEFAAQALIRMFVGWDDENAARAAGSNFARSIQPAQLIAMTDASARWDVHDLLANITARTLILEHTEHPLHSVESARRMAANIRGAQLVLLDGPVRTFLEPEVVQIVGQFLLDVPPEVLTRPAAPEPPRARTAVVLFADIADSTARTEQLGDAAFHAVADQLHGTLREVVRRHHGRCMEGRLLGDGIVALFESARDAVAAALDCVSRGDAAELPLHVAIHAGDVLESTDNVHGGAVNAAARIAAMAPPGEVLASDIIRGLARTSTTAVFEDRGSHLLKGIAEPQRVFRVTRRRAAPEGERG